MGKAANQAERAVFIGAGFSIPMGYPSGAQLPHELIRRLSGENSGSNSLRKNPSDRRNAQRLIDDLNELMHRYLRPPGSAAFEREHSGQPLDVAEFYSVAQALSETPELLVPGYLDNPHRPSLTEMRSLYPRIAAATRTYFNDIIADCARGFPADIRSVVADLNPAAHAVVNFNWDEEVDAEMARSCDNIVYTRQGWRGRNVGLILKPHGSISWYDLVQGVYNSDIYFVAGGDTRLRNDQRRLIAYPEMQHPVMVGGGDHGVLECPPAIAPPTFSKRFNHMEQQLIWQDAITVCAQASEFVFLGYRVPKDDFLTRAALRAAMTKKSKKKKVLVVTNDSDPTGILATFRSIFGAKFSANNILNHEFGTGGRSFARELERRLAQAGI